MNTVRLALRIALLAGCVSLAGWSGAALGQGGPGVEDPAAVSPAEVPLRSPLPDRALRRARPAEADAIPAQSAHRAVRPWAPYRRPGPPAIAQATSPETESAPSGDQPEVIKTPPPLETKPAPSKVTPREMQPGEIGFEPVPGTAELSGPGCDERGEGCDACGAGSGDFCGDEECVCGMHRLGVNRLLTNMSFFAGVQGFKGPLDLGRNGNFGFHEGLNYGGPLGDPWCIGYQLGFQGVESNFAGSQPNGGSRHGREQAFVTGGLFHRAPCGGGLQGGVAFDYLHDSYYLKADLKQIRSETSIVFDGCNEIGYWGAYGLSKDRFRIADQGVTLFQPNDIFAAFYRRQFSGGGQGRFWGGSTGGGEGIIGAELLVPLGSSWALENSFTYLIPKHGPTAGGQQEEGWSLSISLVWYPGRSSQCVLQNPYQPLFGVGDNSTFMVRR